MHNREDVTICGNGISPISAVGGNLPRGRYVGGLGTLTSCIDGDCRALDVLDAIADLIDGARGTTMATAELRRTIARMQGATDRNALQFNDPILTPGRKKKRKVSKYQKEFGKVLKQLKVKHPRTPITKLMKRAHRETKRRMKK